MTVYGYARVSTKQQDLAIQLEDLQRYGIDQENIFMDKLTGAKMEGRKSLADLLEKVKKGDLIIVKKLDRLGRSVSQVTGLIEKLYAEGIYVKSIDDGVDTSVKSTMGTAMMQLLAMFSEMERNFIEERTKPAIERARAEGVKFGRPKAPKKIYEMAIAEYLEGGIKAKELVKKYGTDSNGKDLITEATFYRRLKEYKKREGIN